MQIGSYEILDGSGANVVGGSAIKEDYTTLVKAARKAQSRALFAYKFGETDNVVVVEFGDSTRTDQEQEQPTLWQFAPEYREKFGGLPPASSARP